MSGKEVGLPITIKLRKDSPETKEWIGTQILRREEADPAASVATHRKVYDDAMFAAGKVFEEARVAAREATAKAYREAMAPAEKTYKEITDAALKAYMEAPAKAREPA